MCQVLVTVGCPVSVVASSAGRQLGWPLGSLLRSQDIILFAMLSTRQREPGKCVRLIQAGQHLAVWKREHGDLALLLRDDKDAELQAQIHLECDVVWAPLLAEWVEDFEPADLFKLDRAALSRRHLLIY